MEKEHTGLDCNDWSGPNRTAWLESAMTGLDLSESTGLDHIGHYWTRLSQAGLNLIGLQCVNFADAGRDLTGTATA